MKLNWGTGIVGGFLLFVILLLMLVGISLSSRTDVVTDHYYEKGLHYQEQIATLRRTATRQEKLAIIITGHEVTLKFPRSCLERAVSGAITLYRPSDRTRDVFLPLRIDSAGTQSISTATMERGVWKLQILWHEGMDEFYHEQRVIVQ